MDPPQPCGSRCRVDPSTDQTTVPRRFGSHLVADASGAPIIASRATIHVLDNVLARAHPDGHPIVVHHGADVARMRPLYVSSHLICEEVVLPCLRKSRLE